MAYLIQTWIMMSALKILRDLERAIRCRCGINLLREGLDLPEVSLIAIMDAMKGFLRSTTSPFKLLTSGAHAWTRHFIC